VFGYVKPVARELKVKEYEFYKATYCGICRAMKKHTGELSNVMLSYDSVFLALVRMAYIDDSELGSSERRCIAHPFTKKTMLNCNSALEYTARAFAILAYYKLADDLQDEKFLKKMMVSFSRPIASSSMKKANMPELCEIAKDRLERITALEKEKCPSADEPAILFGELLGEMFSGGLEGEARLVTYQVGYHLGKFIYCADAAEDYEKDRASGSYNPYVISYEGRELTSENKSTIRTALLLECRQLEAAVNLIPFGNKYTCENIVRNIIYLGLVERISFLEELPEQQKEDTTSD